MTILRELTQGGLVLPGKPGFAPSYREVSKRLSIPFGTIRNRINTMYKVGVLNGSSLYPNPNLFKLRAGAYTTDVPAESGQSGGVPKTLLRRRISERPQFSRKQGLDNFRVQR